jgi:two-component system chemotaxis response regulator CheB
VVLHLSPTAPSVLPEILQRAGGLRVSPASDGMALSAGTMVVAIPDHHLCLDDAHVRLTTSAKENGHRPAIDTTLRSAAKAYGAKTVGLLLSGMLDDGVLGLKAVHDVGGTTAVQDPEQASYPSMPASAIRAGVARHVLPTHELAAFVTAVTRDLSGKGPDRKVVTMSEAIDPLRPGNPEGEVSSLTCPNCGGALWEGGDDDLPTYQCRTGHSFLPAALVDVQAHALDDALWGAYRSLLEQAELHRRLARRLGESATAAAHIAEADRARARAELLRETVLDGGDDDIS